MATISELYEYEDKSICDLGIQVPAWIEQDINCGSVAAVCEGGCASGAYMPAVTYVDALETMNTYGDAVLQYVEDRGFEIKITPGEAWSGLACRVLSLAVDLWCVEIAELIEFDDPEEDEE